MVDGGRAAARISPDGILTPIPPETAAARVAALKAVLRTALAGAHHLVAGVPDARASFAIRGAGAEPVLMTLRPVDVATLAEGEIRRGRAAPAACAFRHSAEDEFTLVAFRSLADYVMAILESAARPGSALFPA